jgi:Tfp pilus assembly pilus retraction ATPase PilT
MLATHVQTGRDAGMIPLERSLARLVRSGVVDLAVARAAAADLDYFDRAVRAG